MPVVIDTPVATTSRLEMLKAGGIRTIIRYINPLSLGSAKTVKAVEAQGIANIGMRLGLVCEGWGGAEGHGGIDGASGARDGRLCAQHAKSVVGAPPNACIYFAVDTDVSSSFLNNNVIPYFQEVKDAVSGQFRIGVYGCGLVCDAVLTRGLADLTWLSNAMGWAGSRAFRDNGKWNLLQHLPMTIAGLDTDPNDINPARPDIGDFVPFAVGDTAPPPVVYDILWVQRALNQLGADPQLVTDGKLGPMTNSAIVKQLKKDLGDTTV